MTPIEAIRAILDWFLNIGTSKLTKVTDIEFARTANLILLVFFVAAVCGLPGKFQAGSFTYNLIAMIDPILYLVCFLLTKSGRHFQGAILALLTANFAVLGTVVISGRESNVHFYFWGLTLVPSILFLAKRLVTGVFLLLPAVSFVLVEHELIPTGVLSLPHGSALARITPTILSMGCFIAVALKVILDFERKQKTTDSQMVTIQNQQMQITKSATYSAIAEMASGVAHEINNPLAVIMGNIDMIGREISEETPNRQRISHALEKSRVTVERISKIIAGLRNLSRDTATEPLARASVATIIEDACSLCYGKFDAVGIRLEVSAANPRLVALCKPGQLAQVILSLLNNSYDAVGTLPERWVKVDAEVVGDSIQIRITDSGNGIPKEIATKIMDPFFTTKKAGQGSGLGLAVSKKLLEEQSGSLALDMNSKNTSFVIELPRAKIDE